MSDLVLFFSWAVEGLTSNVSYQYDIANRLATANGASYTYDDNGNLLADGANTYAYDSANRLSSVSREQGVESSYQYNGLGDRLSQNGVNYTLDLNSGLTQVLSDGTTSYTYGLGRIAQSSIVNQQSEIGYFLGDALGSVRLMTDQAGAVTYAAAYDPYGVVTQSGGVGQSAWGYTGEQQDASGLVYLRARYYNPADGRFQSRDTWEGSYNSPQSLNRWNYTQSNPINYTDPSGNYCIAGFDVDFLGGDKCTDANRQKAVRAFNYFAGLYSPSFRLGMAYEVLDSALIVGPEMARLTWSAILKVSPGLNNLAEGIAISAALCGNKTPRFILDTIKNGIRGDYFFSLGRAVGRTTMAFVAIDLGLKSIGGTAVSVAASPFTFGFTLSATAVSVAMAGYSVAVLGNIAIKEVNDHLVAKAFTGDLGGDGGGFSDDFLKNIGSLPPETANEIQSIVDEAGEDLYVVGGYAKGKPHPRKDIDYGALQGSAYNKCNGA